MEANPTVGHETISALAGPTRSSTAGRTAMDETAAIMRTSNEVVPDPRPVSDDSLTSNTVAAVLARLTRMAEAQAL